MAAARIRIVMPRVPGFDSPVAPYVVLSLIGHVVFAVGWALAPMLKSPPVFPRNAVAVSLVGSPPAAGPKAAAPVTAAKPAPSKPKTGMRVENRPVEKPEPLPEKIAPKKAEPKEPEPRTASGNDTAAGEGAVGTGGSSNSAAGAGTTGISAAGGGDVRFDWYRSAVTAALHSNWRRPVVQRQTDAFEVIVSFDIQRNGNVANLTLAQSSGVAVLDRSALRAVADAQPLPPLPPAWSDAVLPATYIFRLFPE